MFTELFHWAYVPLPPDERASSTFKWKNVIGWSWETITLLIHKYPKNNGILRVMASAMKEGSEMHQQSWWDN